MNRWQATLISQCERLPGISYYARSRGWPFILSWVHRLTGIILVLYLLVHVYTLSSLAEPAVFAAKMASFKNPFFSFLEWAIAIPLGFHAFNGTRLILFEIFYVRDDSAMIRWVAALGAVFLLMLAYLMIAGDQHASGGGFWFSVLIITGISGYVVYTKVNKTGNRSLWKLQRVSGALLLPMLSAHMLFMHMNYPAGHSADVITIRMQHYFTKVIDITIVFLIVFHGAYGLCSIINDYVGKNFIRKLSVLVTLVAMVMCGWAAIRLVIAI
jgi:succinate dehydrogenase / fumarate reductase cytochrome b subunit